MSPDGRHAIVEGFARSELWSIETTPSLIAVVRGTDPWDVHHRQLDVGDVVAVPGHRGDGDRIAADRDHAAGRLGTRHRDDDTGRRRDRCPGDRRGGRSVHVHGGIRRHPRRRVRRTRTQDRPRRLRRPPRSARGRGVLRRPIRSTARGMGSGHGPDRVGVSRGLVLPRLRLGCGRRRARAGRRWIHTATHRRRRRCRGRMGARRLPDRDRCRGHRGRVCGRPLGPHAPAGGPGRRSERADGPDRSADRRSGSPRRSRRRHRRRCCGRRADVERRRNPAQRDHLVPGRSGECGGDLGRRLARRRRIDRGDGDRRRRRRIRSTAGYSTTPRATSTRSPSPPTEHGWSPVWANGCRTSRSTTRSACGIWTTASGPPSSEGRART